MGSTNSTLNSAASSNNTNNNNNTLGLRVSKLEDFLKANNVNLNLSGAYQQIGLLYNQFKNTLDITREDLDKQIADFERLKAYVNSLSLSNIPPEIWDEFSRVAAFIKSLFNNQQKFSDELENRKAICAFGEAPNKVQQYAGTIYTFTQNTFTSDVADIEAINGGFTIKRQGVYRVMLFARVANDRGDRSRASVAIYLNGSQVVSAPSDAWWEFLTATAIAVIRVQTVPVQITAGCSESWHDDSPQYCRSASLMVERLVPL